MTTSRRGAAPLITYLLIAANVVIFMLSPGASIGHSRTTPGMTWRWPSPRAIPEAD